MPLMRVRILANLILALTTLAGAFYGVEKIGGREIAPGTETGFQWRGSMFANSPRLLLTREKRGDMRCRIVLTVATPITALKGYSASLAHGPQLGLYPRKVDAGRAIMDIAQLRAGADTSTLDAFMWKAGSDIEIAGPAGATVPHVTDWAVFLSEADPDTRVWAERRETWQRVAWTLFAVFAVGSIIQIFIVRERLDAPPTVAEVIDRMIDSVEGVDRSETRQFRKMLRKSRSGVSKSQAMRAAGLDADSITDKAKWYRATVALSEHVTNYSRELRDSIAPLKKQ
jgi:hypothetical protein